MLRYLGSGFGLVLLGLFSGEVLALTPAEIFARVSPSVWQIRTYDKEGLPLAGGSAVVIGTETLVTNCHVLSKSSRFTVMRDNMSLGGVLEMWDTERDLCQIKVRNLNAPAVKLGSANSLAVGQSVYTLGNPKGLELTLSDGLVSSLRRNEQGQLVLIQTSAPLSMGSSGGGLFDDQGRLVGVTTLSVKEGQNLNFAIPVDWIRDLPTRHRLAQQKREAEKVAVQQEKAVPQVAGKVWRYEYRDVYDKRREIKVTARDLGKETLSEGVEVGAVDAGTLQWVPGSPIMRPRSGGGIEWVEVSPYVFAGPTAGRYRGRIELDALGEKFSAVVREYGEERVSVGAGAFDAVRLEINAERKSTFMSGSPIASAVHKFRIRAWYAKEIGRVVKLAYVSMGAVSGTVFENYEMSLVAKAE